MRIQDRVRLLIWIRIQIQGVQISNRQIKKKISDKPFTNIMANLDKVKNNIKMFYWYIFKKFLFSTGTGFIS